MIENLPELSAPPKPEISPEQVQRWSVPECPFVITYSTEITDHIRRRSLEAFLTLPHGGLEIGGVLFGRVYPNARTPTRVEILAEREIECSHATGPDFVLSDEEAARIPAIFERARRNPELAAFPVVGLWISHSRSGLVLKEQDSAIFQRHFPHAWQVVLVLKPESSGTTGTFFFRAGGRVQAHEQAHEFAWSRKAPLSVPLLVEPETAESARIVERMPRRYSLPTLVMAIALSALTGAAIMWLWR